MSAAHLAPYVDVSRQKYRKRVKEELEQAGVDQISQEQINAIAEQRTRQEIKDGMQTFVYQIGSIMGSNGQTPFISFYMDINEAPEGQTRDDLALIIEETLNQRIKGMKNEFGVYTTPAFPKYLYVCSENNIEENSPFYYLTELAAKCTAIRMNPDFISSRVMLERKGDVYGCMGCRSFLTVDRFTDAGVGNISKSKTYVPGKHRYYARFNQGVCTINLPYIALLAGGDEEKFWPILDKYIELAHDVLMVKHNRLKGTKAKVAPILWMYGALARLDADDVIDPLLYHGYSTISLGYSGISEMTYAIKGVPHTDPVGKEFALKVMQRLNDKCAEYKAESDIDFSVYGTPIETTTEKFARALQKKFGVIEHVSDRNYVTNSFHQEGGLLQRCNKENPVNL